MTALDMTGFEASTDTPEVAALKRKVWEIAMKYKTDFRWCSEVNKALKEAGIEEEKKVAVEVTTSLGMVLTASVVASALVGQTEAKQKEAVVAALGDIRLAGDSGASGKWVIKPANVTSMALKSSTAAEVKTGAPAPSGYAWLYTSESSGYVMHLFPETTRSGAYSNNYALCNSSYASSPSSTSRRDSTRAQCRRCLHKIGH